jgi:aspartyl-tRNA(Asn)/glutamyl-tRNA(Gln) amidotransferase subunit A
MPLRKWAVFLKSQQFLKNNMDIFSLTIKEALGQLQQKKLSSVELVKACLYNIEKKNKQVNAILTINDAALDDAILADKQFNNLTTEQLRQKPLLGIPIVLKDAYSTKGLRTTAASKLLENYIPPYDATVVKKLKEAGAIIVGKANMDAWAHGSSGENSDFGPSKNPYALEHTPGGSSSGSAASIASGMGLMATGTDTGGSIRLPAAFCNLVGLKPTYGRVSRYGIIAMGSSFDSIGHMTKTVWDNAYVLSITAGKDELDATTSNFSVPDYTSNLEKSIAGLKVGVIKEFMTDGMNPEVRNVTQTAYKRLEEKGCKLVEISLPHIDYAMATYYILIPAEVSSNLGRMDGVRFGFSRDHFGDEAKRRIMIGTYTLSAGYYEAYYNKALKVRTLIKQDFEKAFEKVDVIAAPVSPSLPFKLGEKANDPLSMYLSDIYVCPMNLAGVPSLAVPAGYANGFPVGIQFAGPHFSEHLLYQIAYQYEQARGYLHLKPKL